MDGVNNIKFLQSVLWCNQDMGTPYVLVVRYSVIYINTVML